MANEKAKERIASTLRYVADNIDSYLPQERLLDDSKFVVHITGRDTIPTVELDAEMPAIDLAHPQSGNGTTSEQS